MLAPDELEAAVMTDQQRLAKSQESSSTSLMKNVKAAKVPKTMFDVSSMPKPAIEHVLNTLVLDEFFELRMEQERIALLLLLRGDPLKIDKDDDGGDDAESEDDEEEKKSEAGDHVAVEIEDEPFLKEATPRAQGPVPAGRAAIARTVLDDVLEGNVVMAFIMLLVIGTILYEQVLGLMYGLSNGFVDTYVLFLIMWIFTAETAELGEETYKLAMTLLNTGNKEIYDAFQACARSNSAEKQFFAERHLGHDGLRCRGARGHSETTDVERYERAETEARGLESASSKAVALGAFAPDAREIVETTKTAEAISSSELAGWLASIVANYSAADQLLIQHAIETSTKKGVPETSPAINEAKTALMGLRYGQLNAVLVAALGMLSVLMTDSISKILDACTDGVNFATVVTPNEPELTQLSQWSTEGKIYFVSLSVGFMNFWIAVYMLCYMEWNKRRDTNEKTLKRFAGILNSYGSVDKFAALLSIISSLNYGISVTSIFSVFVTLVATKTAKTIEKTVANLPKVQDWMLDPDARFTSTSHLRRLLLSIAPSASKHIEEAVALLSEGDLERAASPRLLLLRNAVRFPRVVKAKKG
ncbi:cellulose 1,4-beta-cellobiosidase [Aureococcus anophagefferens]|nr:cellulose 1,4-beta-cellobiosidase [Aureococcus anophagefferens]